MLFGVLLLIAEEHWFVLPQWFACGIGTIVLLLLFLSDFITEKLDV